MRKIILKLFLFITITSYCQTSQQVEDWIMVKTAKVLLNDNKVQQSIIFNPYSEVIKEIIGKDFPESDRKKLMLFVFSSKTIMTAYLIDYRAIKDVEIVTEDKVKKLKMSINNRFFTKGLFRIGGIKNNQDFNEIQMFFSEFSLEKNDFKEAFIELGKINGFVVKDMNQ